MQTPLVPHQSHWIVACQHGLSAKIQEEIVMLDSATGVYFALNDVAAMLFEQIREPRDVVELARFLEREYAVSRERSMRDVIAFAEELVKRGFAKWMDPPESPL